jgi:hypothetical protein
MTMPRLISPSILVLALYLVAPVPVTAAVEGAKPARVSRRISRSAMAI